MKSDNSHVKLTCGRVISSIFILSVLLSSWVLLSEKAIKLVRFIQHSLQNSEESIDALMNNEDGEFERLKLQMSEIHKKLMESQMADFSELQAQIKFPLQKYSERFRSEKLREYAKSFLFTYIDDAENLYKQCIEYMKIEVSDDELCTFAQSVTSNSENGLSYILRRIETHVLPAAESQPYGNLFGAMRNHFMDNMFGLCERVPIQQRVYEFFELLIRNEKIAFSAYKLLYSILTQCYQEKNTNEEESALEEIIRRIRKYTALISTVMTDLPCDVRRCSPPDSSTDENFFIVEQIDPTIPTNGGKIISWDGCTGTCSNISEKAISITNMSTEDIMNMAECDTCESLESGHLCRRIYHEMDDISIPSEPVHVENGPQQGSLIRATCEHILSKKKQYEPLGTEGSGCNECVCKCTNPDVKMKLRHAFSLRPQEANVLENMIVTGIRFHRTKYSNGVEVIYPQIKVAKLSPEGLSGGVWKDVGNSNNSSWPSGEAGVDYAIIGRGENQSMIFNLDDNRGKPGYVVTGVKFQLRYDQYREKRYGGDIEKSFEIVVRLTPCNFTTAHLSASQSIYIDSDAETASSVNNSIESKTPIRTRFGGDQTYIWAIGSVTRPRSGFHHYVEISKDAMTHIHWAKPIPYFNLQSIDPTPAFPLFMINIFCENQLFMMVIQRSIEFRVTTVSITDLLGFQRYKNLSAIPTFIGNPD